MWKTREGSTASLLQLCFWYFFFYVITGVTVKWFTGSAEAGYPGMKDAVFLVYSTAGGTAICMAVVIARRWFRLQSNGQVRWGGMEFPREFLYIIPSGVCTAVIIPTTTLNYMLLPSVMVAMVVTRGSVIIISRIVDALQIWRGILHRKVFWQEDTAVVFAILAVAAVFFIHEETAGDNARVLASFTIPATPLTGETPVWFGLVGAKSAQARWGLAAVVNLLLYVLAYALRIYIMNYYKNTRARGVKQDNKGFFAIEQISATGTLLLAGTALFFAPALTGWSNAQVDLFRGAITNPHPMWTWAVLAGMAYGMVAFFSVFIFIFKGRTATFTGLVNRLTSLVAGTAATVVWWKVWGGKPPKWEDWLSLALILIAVGFLTLAERRRAAELVDAHEIGDPSGGAPAVRQATA